MGPERVTGEVDAASLPFWHCVWNQQPKSSVVCTAVIHIIAALLGAASGWSVLHLLSSCPSRKVLSGALQWACKWLLGQAVCSSVYHSPLCYTYICIHSIVRNRSEKDLKRASSSLFRDKSAVPGLHLGKGA